MQIITGKTGIPHITSQQDREKNMAVFGKDGYVLPIGNEFSYEIQNSNTIRIFDGMLVFQGVLATIEAEQYDDVTIETGINGSERDDLICVKYEKDLNSGYESTETVVIKGEINGGIPVLPAGNIRSGSPIVYFPLYQVTVTDAATVSVKKLFEVLERNLSFRQKVLWQGAYWMNSTHTITLAEKVSQQNTGIVLEFCAYVNGQAADYEITPCFVSKTDVAINSGKGFPFDMGTANFSKNARKYLYISDGKISGNDMNESFGTNNGVTYDNRNYVLRRVIGV